MQTTQGWARMGTLRHVVHRRPVATTVVRDRFGLAPLPDAGALARLLDLDQGELAWFADVKGLERTVEEPLRHYRWHAVERRGRLRLLAEPKPRLKEAQRRLLRHVLAPVPVHDAAHGCVPGRSVRTAAEPHAGSAVVLGMDLEAFFASVSAQRVWGLLQGTAGLTEPVAHLVTALVTTRAPASVWRALPVPAGAVERERHRRLGARLAVPHLPQGAPTSPALANLVCFRLDRRLAGLAAAFGARYTRYVDDLTFSGDRRIGSGRLAAAVTEVAAEEGFGVNPAKTRVAGAASRQRVLGAVVNARPTLSRTGGTRCARCCTTAPGTAGHRRSGITTRRPSATTSSAASPGPPRWTRCSANGCGRWPGRSTGAETGSQVEGERPRGCAGHGPEPAPAVEVHGRVPGLDAEAHPLGAPPTGRVQRRPQQQCAAHALAAGTRRHPDAELRDAVGDEAVARVVGVEEQHPHHADAPPILLGDQAEVTPF